MTLYIILAYILIGFLMFCALIVYDMRSGEYFGFSGVYLLGWVLWPIFAISYILFEILPFLWEKFENLLYKFSGKQRGET